MITMIIIMIIIVIVIMMIIMMMMIIIMIIIKIIKGRPRRPRKAWDSAGAGPREGSQARPAPFV